MQRVIPSIRAMPTVEVTMNRRRLAVLAVFFFLLGIAQTVPTTTAAEPAGSYIVLLHAATPDAALARAEALGADVQYVYRYAVRGFAATMTPEALEELRADASVASITPNTEGELLST